ncbi:MAG: translation elongation factor Ts [bacterium]
MAEITTAMIKELREKTGLGVLDCRNALHEAEGNMEKAVEILRKKGKAVAAKKAERLTSQGLVASYVHMGGRIGTLVEVNCETDFVARTEKFKRFTRDLAMQVAALNPLYLARENVPQEVIEKEKEIYCAQIQDQNKPEHVVERIVEGKMERFYETVCLLEQTFIRDQDKKVKDLITEKIAEFGENIKVSRFIRFVLGDTE